MKGRIYLLLKFWLGFAKLYGLYNWCLGRELVAHKRNWGLPGILPLVTGFKEIYLWVRLVVNHGSFHLTLYLVDCRPHQNVLFYLLCELSFHLDLAQHYQPSSHRPSGDCRVKAVLSWRPFLCWVLGTDTAFRAKGGGGQLVWCSWINFIFSFLLDFDFDFLFLALCWYGGGEVGETMRAVL